MSRKITTFGIFYTQCGQGWFLTFVDIMTCESVSIITRKTGAVEAAHCVGTVSEDVAWSVFALIFVWEVTSFPPKSVVAVTQSIKADSVAALWHLGVAVVPVSAL